MTRNDYLAIRVTNPRLLIYERYKEKHDASKHGRLLSIQEVLTFLPMVYNPQDVLDSILKEYDLKFEVVKMYDKNGNLIRLL